MAEKIKRVLIVSQHYWPEGFRITDICEGFVENGIKVDVLCGLPNYPQGEWFDGYGYFKHRRQTKDGVEIYRSGEIRRKGNTGLRIFLNYVSYPITASFNLFRLIGKKYDAVFCYETSPVLMMIPAIIWSKLTRTPLTTYVLDLWPENLYSVLPVKNKFMRSVAQGVSHWLYRRSDRLIAMSPLLEKKLREISPKGKTTVIPQYCEDFYAQDVFDEKLKKRFEGKFCIVFAGNFSPAQNLDMLIRCAERLKSESRNDIHFVLVGDGMSFNDIKNDIDTCGVSDMFSLEGRMPATQIPQYHTAADALFAALSKSDDLGLTVPAKITSYMAAGRPLLVAIDGEATRVVNDARCGLTSGAGDVDALYNNIIKLNDMSGGEREALGNAAKECYRINFNRDKLLGEIIRFVTGE